MLIPRGGGEWSFNSFLGTTMKQADRPSSEAPPNGSVLEANRLEVIRFGSRDDCRRAIGVLLEHGLLHFSSSTVNQWAVRTDVVRVLRAAGVPFEWLTENVRHALPSA
jgi:hypothetical protein